MVNFILNPSNIQEIDISSVLSTSARTLLENLDRDNDGKVNKQEQSAWLQQSLLDSFTLGTAVYQQEKITQQASDLLTSLYQRAGIFGKLENFSPDTINVKTSASDKKIFLTALEELAQTEKNLEKANRIFSSLPLEGKIETLHALESPALAAKLMLRLPDQDKKFLLQKDVWQKIIPGGGEEKRVAIESLLHCFYDEDTLQEIPQPNSNLHKRILGALKEWQPGINDKKILETLNDGKKFPDIGAEIVPISGTKLQTIKIYVPAQNAVPSASHEDAKKEPEESLVFKGGGMNDEKYTSPSGLEYYGEFGITKLGDGSVRINNPEITGDHLSIEFEPDGEGTIALDLTTNELYWYDLAPDPNKPDDFIQVRRPDVSREEMKKDIFSLLSQC